MKRFVTYLYECERGDKIRNTGFIRVNVRGEETSIEIYIRNISNARSQAKIYALIHEEKLRGIELGEITLEKGQSDRGFSFRTEDILGSGFGVNDIVGMGIYLDDGKYIASCWKDEYAGEIVGEEFAIEAEGEVEEVLEVAGIPTVQQTEENIEKKINYQKIDLSQIRDLPSSNWHLAANSFLVHGFWNYGYLMLKKEVAGDKETLALGVPGIYEKQEAVMAILFGFPNFEEVSQKGTMIEKEKNQETEAGTFGYWFTVLQI